MNHSKNRMGKVYVCAARYLQNWDSVNGLAAIYLKQEPFLR